MLILKKRDCYHMIERYLIVDVTSSPIEVELDATFRKVVLYAESFRAEVHLSVPDAKGIVNNVARSASCRCTIEVDALVTYSSKS